MMRVMLDKVDTGTYTLGFQVFTWVQNEYLTEMCFFFSL